jgi:hypothetical protein
MKQGDGVWVVTVTVARSRVMHENFLGMMTHTFQVVRLLLPIADVLGLIRLRAQITTINP